MITTPTRITDSDFWNAIQNALRFPGVKDGLPVEYLSHDFGIIPESALRTYAAQEEFVAQIKKTDQLAYKLRRTITETVCLDTFPLAKAFHATDLCSPVILPDRLEWSENLKLLHTVCARLGAGRTMFSSNPLVFLGNTSSLLLADFVNGLIQEIREGLIEEKFKDAVRLRKKLIRQNTNAANRLIDHHTARHPDLVGMWLYLADWPESQVAHSLSLNHQTLQRFLHLLALDEIQQKAVGHLWMRRYLTEIGYHVRVLILLDGLDPTLPVQAFETCQHLWSSATFQNGGHGVCFDGTLVHDANELKRDLAIQIGRDALLRLKPSPDVEHYGVSDVFPSNDVTTTVPVVFPLAAPTPIVAIEPRRLGTVRNNAEQANSPVPESPK